MNAKLRLIVALLLVAMIVLSACGSENNNDSAVNAGNSSNADSSNISKAEPVKLTITWWGSQTRHDYTQKLLDLYSQNNPRVTFEAIPSGWDGYYDKLSAQSAGNALPDIIQMDYSFIATFSNNGVLADLQPYVDSGVIDTSNIDDNIISSGLLNGKLTGIPLSVSVLSVIYNPDVFSQAGVETPTPDWTWSDFLDKIYQITEKTGFHGTGNMADINPFTYWVRQYGKNLYADDGTKLGFEDENIVAEYFSLLKDLQDRGAMPNPDENEQIKSLGKEAQPIVLGQSGAIFEWNNFAVVVSGTNPNLKLVTPPQKEGGTKGLWIKPGMFFSIAESSKHKEEAAKFINWFINSKEANDIIKSERGVPISSEIREYMKSSLTPQQQDMFDYIDLAIDYSSAIFPPEPAGSAETTKEFENAAHSVLYNQKSALDAAKQFVERANAILARNAN